MTTAEESRGSGEPSSSQGPGRSLGFSLFLGGLVVASLLLTPAGASSLASRWGEALIWIVFIAASHLLVLPALPRLGVDVSLAAPAIIATTVLLPPPLVFAINFLGFTNERELRREAPIAMSVFNRCQTALSAVLASWVVHTFLDNNQLLSTLVAVVVYNIANTAFVTTALWTRRRLALGSAAKHSTMPFPRFALDFALVTLLSLFVVVAYDPLGAWAVALLAMPIYLGFSALRSAREAEDRANELVDRVRELETLNAAATEFLTARSAGHAATVAIGALGRALETDTAVVSLDGEIPGRALQVIPVPGAEPAAIGVPYDTGERSMAVVEAIAGLFGMTLVRQKLEQDLAEVQRARAALSERILEEGTRERSRVALEIHDDVLPSLAAVQIQADNVRSALQVQALDRASTIAGSAYDAANAAIRRLREVLDDLHRQILVPGALRPHLLDALQELKLHHGIEVALNAPDELPDLPHALEILIQETVRGCLANVARHAQAGRVDVDLCVTGEALRLEVRDDGRGFDSAAVGDGHHGLALMAQRVELARGRFEVVSRDRVGTSVRVELPM
jgi:signal transduction histidine kinase